LKVTKRGFSFNLNKTGHHMIKSISMTSHVEGGLLVVTSLLNLCLHCCLSIMYSPTCN